MINTPSTNYPPRPDNIPDNAIAKAALMIRELHEQTLDQIAAGHVYVKTTGDPDINATTTINVNEEIKTKCLAEIEVCDQIILQSPGMTQQTEARGASLHVQLKELLEPPKLGQEVIPGVDASRVDALAVPEIGVYDHASSAHDGK